jgi:hypothetical protein
VTKRKGELVALQRFSVYGGTGSVLLSDEPGVRQAIFEALTRLSPAPVEPERLTRLSERYVDLAHEYVEERLAEPQTSVEAARQLAEVGGSAAKLAEALVSLRGPAVQALNEALALSKETHTTIAECVEIARRLAAAGKIAVIPPSAKRSKGPAGRAAVLKIARAAADDYAAITGKPPRRGEKRGGFVPFLEALFEALVLEERPGSYAQAAVRGWKLAQSEKDGRPVPSRRRRVGL